MSYLIFFLSGLVTALPFLVTECWFLSWFSLLPMLYLAPKVNKRYLHGLCFGMGFYLPLYYWFIKLYPLDFAGFTPVAGGATVLLCWLGLSLLQGAEMAFIPMLYGRLSFKAEDRGTRWLNPFLAASCFVVFEWFQSLFWHGVPWGRLALSQIGILPMVQSASLLGSMLICFLLVLTNGLLVLALPTLLASVRSRKMPALPSLLPCLLALLVPLANGVYGAIRMEGMEKPLAQAEQVRVSLIQGNISSQDKWDNWTLAQSVEHYLALSEEAIRKEDPDLVLWPETVVTTVLHDAPGYDQMFSDFAKEQGVMLVLGAYSHDEEGNRCNSLYAYYPDGERDENVYSKRHLVPFGEYLPMEWLFEKIPLLANLNLSENALTPGKDSALFDSPFGRLGGLVCFDSIYDTLSRDSTLDGAEMILLSTNDSWYRDSHAIYQHNAHAQLRAIENGRSIARAANTGTSTLILPDGRVIDSLPPLVTGTVTGDLPLMQSVTVYQVVGNLIVWLCLGFLIAVTGLRAALLVRRSVKRDGKSA